MFVELVQDVERIFQDQTTVFKLNLSFGFVLFKNDTEQMQYHHSTTNNNRVFEAPFLVRNRGNLDKFVWSWRTWMCSNGLDSKIPTLNGLLWTLLMLHFRSQSFAITLLDIVRVYSNTRWKNLERDAQHHFKHHSSVNVSVTPNTLNSVGKILPPSLKYRPNCV